MPFIHRVGLSFYLFAAMLVFSRAWLPSWSRFLAGLLFAAGFIFFVFGEKE